jgi:hypothetical protein
LPNSWTRAVGRRGEGRRCRHSPAQPDATGPSSCRSEVEAAAVAATCLQGRESHCQGARASRVAGRRSRGPAWRLMTARRRPGTLPSTAAGKTSRSARPELVAARRPGGHTAGGETPWAAGLRSVRPDARSSASDQRSGSGSHGGRRGLIKLQVGVARSRAHDSGQVAASAGANCPAMAVGGGPSPAAPA